MSRSVRPWSFPTADWLSSARRRWRDMAFVDAREALEAQCALFHAENLPVPQRRAGYYHDDFCPVHAVPLAWDPRQDVLHVCPTGGEVFEGERYTSARLWTVNNHLSRGVLHLGLRLALDPHAATAAVDRARVSETLLGYATVYQRLATDPGGLPEYPGVITYSGLDESVWLVRISWAYGLVSATLTPSERHEIREGLLAPAVAHLWRIRSPASWPPIDNIAVWNAAARTVAAVVTGDRTLLEPALDHPLGLRHQLRDGVREDGLWWEGSLSYHYYTLAAAIWAARTLAVAGLALEERDVIRRMLLAPARLAWPDLTLPAMNDGWYDIGLLGRVGHDIPDAPAFHETARAWFGEAALPASLRRAATRTRGSLERLLDGDGPSGAGEAAPGPSHPTSRPAALTGIAVLRAGGGDPDPVDRPAAMAILKAGPSGGGHGHPDQLAVQYFAAGVRWLDDLGTAGYGIGLNRTWYRATASHNTVVLDGRSQPLADGTISTRPDGGGGTIADGAVHWLDDAPAEGSQGPYVGVSARRQIGLTNAYLLDVIDVECPSSRVIDAILLPRGVRAAPADDAVEAAHVGLGSGYEHVDGVRRIIGGATPLRWQSRPSAALEIHRRPVAAHEEESVFVGVAPGNPASDQLGVLVRRRRSRQARFVTVLVPIGRGNPGVREITWSAPFGGPSGSLVTIVTDRGRAEWELEGGSLHLRST